MTIDNRVRVFAICHKNIRVMEFGRATWCVEAMLGRMSIVSRILRWQVYRWKVCCVDSTLLEVLFGFPFFDTLKGSRLRERSAWSSANTLSFQLCRSQGDELLQAFALQLRLRQLHNHSCQPSQGRRIKPDLPTPQNADLSYTACPLQLQRCVFVPRFDFSFLSMARQA